MITLDDIVVELADHYDGPREPSLIARLDDPAIRTSQPQRVARGPSKPRSRPPVALDAASWSRWIKSEAVTLNRQISRSTLPKVWNRAILDLPVIAQHLPKDEWNAVFVQVARWRSRCLVVLGYQVASEATDKVRCLECKQISIMVRPDLEHPVAWCTNAECVDEATGMPAMYSGPRLGLLSRNRI